MTDIVVTDSSGQDLQDMANSAWNSQRSEYSGPQFRRTTNDMAAKMVVEKGTKRRRRVKREEGATLAAHLFDHLRQADSVQLFQIAQDIKAGNIGPGSLFHSFATDVAESVQTMESQTMGFGVFDPMTLISLLSTVLPGIFSLFQLCKKPAPVVPPVVPPTPTPTPTPTPVPAPAS